MGSYCGGGEERVGKEKKHAESGKYDYVEDSKLKLSYGAGQRVVSPWGG